MFGAVYRNSDAPGIGALALNGRGHSCGIRANVASRMLRIVRARMSFSQKPGEAMPAYVISDVTLRDPDAVEIYRTRAAASIAQYGGRYLARGGDIEVLEGSWHPRAIVIVEFPDVERARAWYRSPEYALGLEVRDLALSRNLILVDGVPLTVGAAPAAAR
jgi:uncharacterized protein (DUF1330 family)